MRRDKRANKYLRILGTAIFCVFLTACGAQDESFGAPVTEEKEVVRESGETYSCSVQELSSYLHHYEANCPYVSADITISGYSGGPSDDNRNWDMSFATGDVEVTWQFYNSLEQMEQELQMREKNRTDATDEAVKDDVGADDNIRLLYYTFPLPENAHALDIYQTLQERYDTAERPVVALYGKKGKFYYFMQDTVGEAGFAFAPDYHHKSAVNLFIIDGFAYALVPKNMPHTYPDGELNLLFSDYILGFGENEHSIRYLSEESLYWIDHEERITVMEEPDRSFVEVRGINANWIGKNEGITNYFGMLKEANYEVMLAEDGLELEISFSYVGDPLATEIHLIRGVCAKESYNMTVTDKVSGRILQEAIIYLSIELPDTITFEDLDADGYFDMIIDGPTHSKDYNSYYSRMIADQSDWYAPIPMLWNPRKERFEKHMYYTVQSGDSLWSISEQFLESGDNWTRLRREKSAPEDSDYLLPGERIYLPSLIYIREDS